MQSATLGLHELSLLLEFGRPGNDRRQVKAESLGDLPSLPFPGVALPIRAVPADYETRFDQSREVPAQRGLGEPVRAQRELLVRGEDDEIGPLPGDERGLG